MTIKRARTQKGTFRPIRSDTKVSTIGKKYGVELGVRADMNIGNYLQKKGIPFIGQNAKRYR